MVTPCTAQHCMQFLAPRSIFWCTLLFGGLKWMKWLRVSTEMEFKGMDKVKHGESAYPAEVRRQQEAVHSLATICSSLLYSRCTYIFETVWLKVVQ